MFVLFFFLDFIVPVNFVRFLCEHSGQLIGLLIQFFVGDFLCDSIFVAGVFREGRLIQNIWPCVQEILEDPVNKIGLSGRRIKVADQNRLIWPGVGRTGRAREKKKINRKDTI